MPAFSTACTEAEHVVAGDVTATSEKNGDPVHAVVAQTVGSGESTVPPDPTPSIAARPRLELL